MRLRRIGITLALAGGMIVQTAGQAAQTQDRSPLALQVIQDNVPVGALHAQIDRSSLPADHTAPERLRTPADALSNAMEGQAKSLLNPRTLARAEDAFLEQTLGTKVPDLGSILSERPRSASSGDASTGGEGSQVKGIQIGFPAGDLDGDDLEDVAEVHVAWDAVTYDSVSLDLKGLSGKTGQVQWSRSLLGVYDFYLIAGSDLDGDGADEIMLLELFLDERSFTGPCTYFVCVADVEYDFTWKLSPLSGLTGSPLWTKTYDGRVEVTLEEANALVAGQFAESFSVTNGNVFPWPTPAGGGDNVVIDAFDYEGVFAAQYASGVVAGAFLFELILFVATDAEVADGASGSQLFSRHQDYQLGGAVLFPAGQTVGDATGDLVWEKADQVTPAIGCAFAYFAVCLAPGHTDLTIEMIDGNSLTKVWATQHTDPMQEWAAASPSGSDLNGDGFDDLFLFQYGTAGSSQGIISGSNGDLLWAFTGESYLDVIGSVGGSPGADLLATEFAYTSNSVNITLTRLDGGTGTELLETVYASEDTESSVSFIWAFLFGDADGDGVSDIGVIEYTHGYETGESTSYLLESGRNGTAVIELSDPDAFMFPAGDLNGDGTIDGLTFDSRYEATALEVDIAAVQLPAGTTEWTRTDSFDRMADHVFLFLYYSPDLSGAGGDDFVYNQIQVKDDLESRFLGIEGTNGAALWAVGDEFTMTTAGVISGTVTSTSGALEGICVSASPLDDWFSTWTVTDASGSFAIGGLADGSYIVRFDDCGAGTYRTQWYNGSSTYEDADLVEIIGGGAVTGIDAVLSAVPSPSEYVLLREQEREYVGIAGDLLVSGPMPGGTVNDCSEDGPSVGGTCFELEGSDRAIELDISDVTGEVIAGYYIFSDRELPFPNDLSTGTFCGESSRIAVPEGADLIWVFAQTEGSRWCDTLSASTIGTVKASFFGIK